MYITNYVIELEDMTFLLLFTYHGHFEYILGYYPGYIPYLVFLFAILVCCVMNMYNIVFNMSYRCF